MRKLLSFLFALFFLSAAYAQSWSIGGNAGTNPAIHFLGTTDNRPLSFRINNQPSGKIDSVTGQTSFGYGAAKNNTGFANTAFGYRCLYLNTSAVGNTAMGYQAMHAGTGSFNTAFGAHSLYQNTSFNNTAIGYNALSANSIGNSNTAIGYNSLSDNGAGWNNAALGASTLRRNTSGGYNTAAGAGAMSQNTTGNYNVAIGGISLFNTTSSQYNTVVGFQSCYVYNLGWNNTVLGANCEINGNDRYNCIAIGQAVTNTANSQARIGNAATNSIGGYANWTNISDGRYKKDITQNVKGLDFIMKLQPVTYHLDITGLSKKLDEGRGKEPDAYTRKAIDAKEKILFSGFVAQQVEKAAEQTGYDFSGIDRPQEENDLYGLRYAEFVVPLVKAMQEQQQQIEELKKQNTELMNRISRLENGSPVFSNDAINVRPNPAKEHLFVQITASAGGQAVLRLYDGKGALVKEQQVTVVTGSNQFSMDIGNIANGIYHLSAVWNGRQVRTAQVMKQ